MATKHGKDGSIKVGANTVAEIQNFSVETQNDLAEDTSMGDAWKTFLVGVNSWSAQIECSWDKANALGQQVLIEGASVTLNLYPEGAGSPVIQWQGTAIIEKVTKTVNRNNVIMRSFTARGNGALVESTI